MFSFPFAWFVIALVLLILELLSMSFVLIMLAFGALIAGLVSLFNLGLFVELVVFCVANLILLWKVRPWFICITQNRTNRSGSDDSRTNMHRLIGQTAIVTLALKDEEGRIRVSGEEWSAKDNLGSGYLVPVGTKVKIVRIEGATAYVEPLS